MSARPAISAAATAPAVFAGLVERFSQISAPDQLGLLNDTEALASVGQVPMSQFLSFAAKLPADGEPLIWSSLAHSLVNLDKALCGARDRPAFRAYARALVQRPLTLVRLGRARRRGRQY